MLDMTSKKSSGSRGTSNAQAETISTGLGFNFKWGGGGPAAQRVELLPDLKRELAGGSERQTEHAVTAGEINKPWS